MTRWFIPDRSPLRVAHVVHRMVAGQWSVYRRCRYISPPPCGLDELGVVVRDPQNRCALCHRVAGKDMT